MGGGASDASNHVGPDSACLGLKVTVVMWLFRGRRNPNVTLKNEKS
jgi:hypothetical protein